jgi:hypothetical protein
LKKLDLDKALHLIASVGVIAGILLLAYELNQNRDMMRSQTRNELSQGVIELLTFAANDAEFQNLVRRGRAGEELSEDEQWQVGRLYLGWFRYWENVHYQYRNGLYDEDEFIQQRGAIRGVLTTGPGVARYWCQVRANAAIERAVKWQVLAGNPAKAAEPPRPAKGEIKALDTDAIGELLDAARGTTLYAPILVAVTTGLRRGVFKGFNGISDWEIPRS